MTSQAARNVIQKAMPTARIIETPDSINFDSDAVTPTVDVLVRKYQGCDFVRSGMAVTDSDDIADRDIELAEVVIESGAGQDRRTKRSKRTLLIDTVSGKIVGSTG